MKGKEMNERIKELIAQATTKEDYYPAGCNGYPEYQYDFNKEKFAKLLINECADVLVKEMNRLDSQDRVLSAQTMDTAQVLIKQHFGVE